MKQFGNLIDNRNDTLRMNMYMSDYVVALTRTHENPNERFVKVLKNRSSSKTGRANSQETIEICCKMIALSVFGNTSMKLFRVELEELIKETIIKKLGDAHDPFQ